MRQDTPHSTEMLLAKLHGIRRNPQCKLPEAPVHDTPAQLQLPFWPLDMRAMPNDICRSAIFTVRKKSVPRVSIQNQPIYVIGNSVITYTGIELRAADDELVWQQILDFGKAYPLDTWFSFSSYQVCKAIGWPTNGRYYEIVHECLLRLKATAIVIEAKASVGKGRAVSLVEGYDWDVNPRGMRTNQRIKVSPGMAKLFVKDHISHLRWITYSNLTPIARRLYDYAASHTHPHPLKLETVRLLCGSDSKFPKKWRQQINDAGAMLEERGMLRRAYVDHNDLVILQR